MDRRVYNRREHRDLPRDVECVVSYLFGEPVAGPCLGPIHRHHTDSENPDSRTVPACERHHPMLEAALRAIRRGAVGRRRCGHYHPYPEGREACERRLNAAA